MNPYDFVRIEWQHPGGRRPAPPQDRFSGLRGRFSGTITTLMPLFIGGQKAETGSNTARAFLRNKARHAIIPGTSLKGLFRSLVETVGGGSWWFFGTNEDGTWPNDRGVNYHPNLPDTFRRPTSRQELDAACRLFGFLRGSEVCAGNVSFDDAVCPQPKLREPLYTCILSSPKPHHQTWYLDNDKRYVRGRKLYFHAKNLQTASAWLPPNAQPGSRQNQYLHPVDAGNVFTFQGHFNNVAEDDFALLLYAIVLEPDMRHKLGQGKPAGLGSVEIHLQGLEIVDSLARYRAGSGGIQRYEGEALNTLISKTIAPYANNQTSLTLQDLRRIWKWPPEHVLGYPGQTWFSANANTPIAHTP